MKGGRDDGMCEYKKRGEQQVKEKTNKQRGGEREN